MNTALTRHELPHLSTTRQALVPSHSCQGVTVVPGCKARRSGVPHHHPQRQRHGRRPGRLLPGALPIADIAAEYMISVPSELAQSTLDYFELIKSALIGLLAFGTGLLVRDSMPRGNVPSDQATLQQQLEFMSQEVRDLRTEVLLLRREHRQDSRDIRDLVLLQMLNDKTAIQPALDVLLGGGDRASGAAGTSTPGLPGSESATFTDLYEPEQ